MKSKRSKIAVLLLVLFAAVLFCTPAIAQRGGKGGGKGGGGKGPSYQIVALDDAGGQFASSIARGMNNLGVAVGQAVDSEGTVAVYWTTAISGGTVTSDIHALADGVTAQAINDQSEIVGGGYDAEGNDLGLYWANPNVAAPIALPPLAGDDFSWAWSMNNDGVICGNSARQLYDENGNPDGRAVEAVVWRVYFDEQLPGLTVSGPLVLPTLAGDSGTPEALTDNDANGVSTIVGGVEAGGLQTAVSWRVQSLADGVIVVDPTAPSIIVVDVKAAAHGVNNSGTICGKVENASQSFYEAVVWTADSTHVLDRQRNVGTAEAADINDGGVIVGAGLYSRGSQWGYRAAVWANSGSSMLLVDKFLSGESPFETLTNAWSVNESGEIVGYGWDGAFNRAFLAVPQ